MSRRYSARNIMINGSLLLASVVVGCLAIEGVFRYLYVPSDGSALSLAGQRWLARHWVPANRLGYRDGKPPSYVSGKTNILVVGDSFVAGHGTNNIEDRFAEQLQHKLGGNWDVGIAARLGWNSAKEFKGLISYPAQARWIVLSYFINDIDDALEHAGIPKPFHVEMPKGWWARSYALNFFYWRLFNIFDKRAEKYLAYRDGGYRNQAIFEKHAHELQRFIDYAKRNNIRLIVVLFPDLRNISDTAWITEKVGTFFAAQNIDTLDLAPLLINESVSRLIVNPYDAHPSVWLHHYVAELLYQRIKESCGKRGGAECADITP